MVESDQRVHEIGQMLADGGVGFWIPVAATGRFRASEKGCKAPYIKTTFFGSFRKSFRKSFRNGGISEAFSEGFSFFGISIPVDPPLLLVFSRL